jgi:hypothetical protein
MQAGARHPVSRRRHLRSFAATLATLVCCAMLPSAAQAVSVPVPAGAALATVQTTVAEVGAPVREVAQDVTGAAQPGSGGISHPAGDRHPVEETIAPVAHAAAASVPASPGAGSPRNHLDEHARHQISHLTATSSGERMSSGRAVHGHRLDGVTRHLSLERSAPAHRPAPAATAAGPSPHAAAAPAVADRAPASSAPAAAASGGSGGLSGGGGFALLVAALLLAGPFLRRQLALMPVVCRPAAFLVVLERPG